MDAVDRELLALEHREWERIGAGDPEVEGRFAADFVSVDARGHGPMTRESVLTELRTVVVDHFDISEARVMHPVAGMALVTYRVDAIITLGGEQRPWNAFSTAVWVRRSGRWQKVFYQSTPVAPELRRS